MVEGLVENTDVVKLKVDTLEGWKSVEVRAQFLILQTAETAAPTTPNQRTDRLTSPSPARTDISGVTQPSPARTDISHVTQDDKPAELLELERKVEVAKAGVHSPVLAQ